MRKRYAKGILVVLAVLLNLGGGTVAFAHSDLDAGSAQPAGHCAGHDGDRAGGELPPDHPELPCCAGGHCACGAASLFFSVPTLLQFVHSSRTDLREGEPPSAEPGNPLRPPIA